MKFSVKSRSLINAMNRMALFLYTINDEDVHLEHTVTRKGKHKLTARF